MKKLLRDLSHLSGLRERQAMEFALVKLIARADLWQFSAVRLLRAVGPPDDQHWVTLGKLERGQLEPVRDPFWFDTSTLTRLADCAQREAAIVTESVTRSGSGPFTTVFPIDTQASVCSLLEVESDLAVSAETEALVDSVLHLFENLQVQLAYSEKDGLTELLNRQTFDNAFLRARHAQATEGDLAQSERRSVQTSASYWLAVINIDHFKRVNDNFGHRIGDEVLQGLARLMRATFRFHDQLCRFDGEEFVVLMRCANVTDAHNALERFRKKVERHVFPQVGHITVSVGFAALRDDDTPGRAFERADKAVYFAKGHGRNQVCSFAMLVESGALVDPQDGSEELDFF